MMKRYTLILLSIAAVLLYACTQDIIAYPEQEQGEGLVLNLIPSGMDILTKTTPNADPTRPGDFDGNFNENILGTEVDLFFFRSSAGFDTPSVYNKRHRVNQRGVVQLPISPADIVTIFGSNIKDTPAKVVVVANFSGTPIDHSRHYTVNELRSMGLATANFKTQFPQEKFVMISDNEDAENPSPMVTITLSNPTSANPVTGTVMMKRVAAKVTFRLTVADEIRVVNVKRDQSGAVVDRTLETWTPQKDNITAYMQYALKHGYLGGEPQPVPVTVPLGSVPDNLPDIFAYGNRPMVATTDEIERTRIPVTGLDNQDPPQPIYGDPVSSMFTVYEVASDVSTTPATPGPFYTYPVTWTAGAAGEPFIKLIIPWKNGNNVKFYYYKVPFKKAPLESNHWYQMTIDVQILGGEDTDPVPLEASYKVVDWVPGTTATATVESARYLSVPKTEWVMYNIDELTIPITSSHDVQIVGYTVKQAATTQSPYASGRAFTSGDKAQAASWIGSNPSIYNPFTDTRTTIDATTTVGTVYATKPNYNAANYNGAPIPATSSATSWFPTARLTRDQIVFVHALNNDMETSNYDIAPYYIRFRVQHKDDHTYYRDIIIEQRPAIVIEAQRNSDMGAVNNYGHTTNDGYAYENGSKPSTSSNRLNTNFNMYIIETSVLPTTGPLKDFILGDPREESYTARPGNANTNTFVQAATVNRGNNQRLAYYYPAGADELYDDYLAPKFRIASSFGASSTMSRDAAIRRCASYQEDGYPAGRWRLPTVAEIKFMAQLTDDGYIPRLLGSSDTSTSDQYSYYWCNSVAVRVPNAGKTGTVEKVSRTSDSNVRCVYDEWFWENTQYETVTKTTFTWGDQTRATVVRTKAAIN